MLTFDIKVNSNLQMVVTLPLKFLLLKLELLHTLIKNDFNLKCCVFIFVNKFSIY